MAVLHDLSPELIDAILLFIPPRQLLNIRLCSRWFDDFISRSSLAQYRLECWKVGVIDDLLPGMSYPERLDALRRREEAWHTLNVRKRYDIRTPSLSCRTFDLTCGVFSLADPAVPLNQGQQQAQARSEGYATLTLPTAPDDSSAEAASRSWKRNALPDNLADYGFSVQELDLAAVLTSKRVPEQPVLGAIVDQDIHIFLHSFDLHLRSIIHGDYHPLAEKPVVRVCDQFPVALRPRCFVQVAGEYVIVMLVHQTLPTLTPDDFDVIYFVRWRSGDVYEAAKFPTLQYQGFVFLSVDTLLFCNLKTTSLDIFSINYGTDTDASLSLSCIRSLRLPFPGGITGYQSRAEPNVDFPNHGPIANPPPAERPFRDDPECAIALFYFTFSTISCTMFVHRRRLLAAAMKSAAPAGSVRTTQYDDWGPNICAWMSDGGSWVTQVQGQRFVTTSPVWNPNAENDEDAMWTMVNVFDFNPHSVRRVLGEMGPDEQKVLPNGNLVEVQLGTLVQMVNMPGMSLETRLPYVRTSLRDLVAYDDAMLDGDNIIGIYPPVDGQNPWTLNAIEVFAIG